MSANHDVDNPESGLRNISYQKVNNVFLVILVTDTMCVCIFPVVVLSVFLTVLEKVPSCDQERESALDEARQNPREAIFIPDCGAEGIYKAVQCHQSTGYCWCVMVDTGRPIPGTSTR